MEIKVLHISTTDITGGAGIAAFRLHKALLKSGIESYILVQEKKSDDEFVIKSSNSKYSSIIRSQIDYLPLRFLKKDKQSIFSISYLPERLLKIINRINPDIIHLHWITGGFVKIETLSEIRQPIIWSLHDMWAFTGGCHYDNECGQYKLSCNNCPMLNKRSNLSKKIFNRKKSTYQQKSDLYINGLSRWLYNCAKESCLFSKKKVLNIPNCINVKEFYHIDKNAAKEKLEIDINKKNILFGAVAATIDKRKGFDLLKDALCKMKVKENKTFSVFGSKKTKLINTGNLEFNYLGHISNIELLRTVYSAADVIVIPSRQENLSNVVMEALACGTPVVAFNIGGMPDMIIHKKTGYLAQAFNTDDLLRGIEWVLANPENINFTEKAQVYIKSNFSSSNVAKQYIDAYSKIISKSI